MSRHLIALTAATLAACSAGMQPSASGAPMQPLAPQTSASRAFAENLTTSAPREAAPAAEPPAAATPAARPRHANLSCDIVVQPTSRGIRLEAIARATAPVSGRYSLIVTKHGRAGSSDITQGGSFESSRNEEMSLGLAELSVEEASRYQAVLTLHVSDRQVCRREVHS